jgi:hypothetical protein
LSEKKNMSSDISTPSQPDRSKPKLTIMAMKTLKPNANDINVLSPLACVQAATLKKLSRKIPGGGVEKVEN